MAKDIKLKETKKKDECVQIVNRTFIWPNWGKI